MENNENIEKLMKEVELGAGRVDLSLEDAVLKIDEICQQNGLDKNEEPLVVMNLWRQYVASVMMSRKKDSADNNESPTNAPSNGWLKQAFGMFVSLDESRDMMEWSRDNVFNEYNMDKETTLESGKVAVVNQMEDGTYQVIRYHEGERQERFIQKLPAGAMALDSSDLAWIVPLDAVAKYREDPNPNYGKPLPKEEFRRSGVFVGEVDGKFGKYYFNYKGDSSKAFEPKTFDWVSFNCIINSFDETKIHGITTRTLASLVVNDELPDDADSKRDMSQTSKPDLMMEYAREHYVPLNDLDRAHSMNLSKTYLERFVITDGNVASMILTPTANGNRIVSISDLNADFEYDGDGYVGTTCWIPSGIEIDFGVGSDVIVVGRTSQRTNDDGSLDGTTLNVSGLFVTSKRGKVVEVEIPVEDDTDWF
tara:strand:- start:12132 stop:13397 length:1266 start_codon:yes stop_codon:yes gene_type:complete